MKKLPPTIIDIYVMGESAKTEEYVRQIRADLPEEYRKNSKVADYESHFYPVHFHITSFDPGWTTRHIITIRPESKTKIPVTADYFREQFRKIRNFIRNQNYKNPVLIHVYEDTLPVESEQIRAAVLDILSAEKNIRADFPESRQS